MGRTSVDSDVKIIIPCGANNHFVVGNVTLTRVRTWGSVWLTAQQVEVEPADLLPHHK